MVHGSFWPSSTLIPVSPNISQNSQSFYYMYITVFLQKGCLVGPLGRKEQWEGQGWKEPQPAGNFLPRMPPTASLSTPHPPPPLLRISGASSRKPPGAPLDWVRILTHRHLPHCYLRVLPAPYLSISSIGFGTGQILFGKFMWLRRSPDWAGDQ